MHQEEEDENPFPEMLGGGEHEEQLEEQLEEKSVEVQANVVPKRMHVTHAEMVSYAPALVQVEKRWARDRFAGLLMRFVPGVIDIVGRTKDQMVKCMVAGPVLHAFATRVHTARIDRPVTVGIRDIDVLIADAAARVNRMAHVTHIAPVLLSPMDDDAVLDAIQLARTIISHYVARVPAAHARVLDRCEKASENPEEVDFVAATMQNIYNKKSRKTKKWYTELVELGFPSGVDDGSVVSFGTHRVEPGTEFRELVRRQVSRWMQDHAPYSPKHIADADLVKMLFKGIPTIDGGEGDGVGGYHTRFTLWWNELVNSAIRFALCVCAAPLHSTQRAANARTEYVVLSILAKRMEKIFGGLFDPQE